MTLLAIDWGVVGIKAGQFILSFSILIVLHELGHFLPAKWFKCRVEKFYLFFNPWFSLFKKKKGETEYGIGWIPLGGYVKISGMIDESMDKEQMKQPAQPWEFRSKPAWQRLIIMLGGVTVNIILAILIFIMILWVWGKEYLPPESAKFGIVADSLAQTVGLKDGDIVLKVGDQPIEDITRLRGEIVLNDEYNTMEVKRNDSLLTLTYDDELIKALNTRKALGFASIRIPFIVSVFSKESNGEKAGLKKGDRIIALDSVPTPYYNDFQRLVKNRKDETIHLTVLRGNDTLQLPVSLNKEGRMGVGTEGDIEKLGFVTRIHKYSFLQAIPAGFTECWQTLGRYMTGLKQLFSGKAKASESLGSVISIGSIFPDEWNWQSFWTLTAIFSIILAFMNVLPIPGLDGGHALFTLAEIITGRKPGDKFMEYAQMVGMVLLLGLMAYALGLDIWRIFR
ncbi:MAG TPA: RIP metalloprotease RseP [Chitinophagaceae bacterium]|nr:RIP metalloprotease RseP [Chitinophagaceae bacterium]